MIRGTTPDFILEIEGADLTDKTVYVTIAQGTRKLTKTGDEFTVSVDSDGSLIALTLTQEDTLGLSVGAASVQVKFVDETGHVEATDIASINVSRALLERVVDYVRND